MLKKLLILLLFLSFSFNVFSNSFLSKSFWKNATLKEVKEKIASGVDINAYSQYYSETALMYAAKHNKNSEFIKILITSGANINALDTDAWSALMYAAKYNENLEIITTLITQGANINPSSKGGVTALMLAAKYNKNPKIVTTLIANGANIKLKDAIGKTAFDYIKINKYLKNTIAAYKELSKD